MHVPHACGRLLGVFVLSTCLFADNASALNAGDVAVISFASDNPDALAFVALREIPASTVIRFTDSGWLSSGGFRANEGGIQYTAPATLFPGTVVSRTNPFNSSGWSVSNVGVGSNGFALATAGDQILAFTGNAGNPNFVHSVHFDSTGYVNAVSSNTTGLPPGLVVGQTAVDLAEVDNGYYGGPTTGTPAELLAAIANPSNWTTSNSPITPPAWSFTVLGQGPSLQDVSVPASTFAVGEMTTVGVTLSESPDVGSPVTVALSSGAFVADVMLSISEPDVDAVVPVTMSNEGIWSVTATITAGGVGTVESQSFTVGAPMFPPVVDAGSGFAVELNGPTVTVSLAGATASDADGLAGATYVWTPATAPGLVGWQDRMGLLISTTDPGDAQVTFDAIGAYVLTLTVTDADGLVDSDTTVITVNNPTPSEEFDPPAGYYDGATGLGATLKLQLAQIITAGHVQQTYGEFMDSAARYDADPDVPGNILLAYSRASISGTWDGGGTWNREHVWPQSRQPGEASNSTRGHLGDPFALRPINPSTNSSRGNKPFGLFTSAGGFGSAGSYYFPGDADKGDVARSQFYSATRYMDTLTLVSGFPSGNQMGDLDALLRWNYTDPPDFFERRRSQLIYEDQNNRNPYVDHPEFVWSIFGDGANDSTLFVSPTEPTDGSSVASVSFDPIIVGGPLPAPAVVTLTKSGVDPTYYAVTTTGDATCDRIGRFNAFDFDAQQAALAVGMSIPVDSVGAFAGSVIIDNLDISSEGMGQGADDGDDIIDVAATVFDHSEASFDAIADLNTLVIDFGAVPAIAGAQAISYTLFNVSAPSGFTAALDLDSVAPSGDLSVLSTDATPFGGLAGGAGVSFDVVLDPAAAGAGNYLVTITFTVSDEDLPGGIAGDVLTLTATGTISAALFPFDDDGDGDVDPVDGANFISCLVGPEVALLNLGCTNHDWDQDGDVDVADAAALQQLTTGMLP